MDMVQIANTLICNCLFC